MNRFWAAGGTRVASTRLVYGVLAVLLLRALSWGATNPWTWRHVLLAISLAALYGVSDEVHQTYVPQRTGHPVDVGWDLLGAVAGVVIVRLVPRLRLRRASVHRRPD
jgi:VanZ family protein